jgi:hypothetical protein
MQGPLLLPCGRYIMYLPPLPSIRKCSMHLSQMHMCSNSRRDSSAISPSRTSLWMYGRGTFAKGECVSMDLLAHAHSFQGLYPFDD